MQIFVFFNSSFHIPLMVCICLEGVCHGCSFSFINRNNKLLRWFRWLRFAHKPRKKNEEDKIEREMKWLAWLVRLEPVIEDSYPSRRYYCSTENVNTEWFYDNWTLANQFCSDRQCSTFKSNAFGRFVNVWRYPTVEIIVIPNSNWGNLTMFFKTRFGFMSLPKISGQQICKWYMIAPQTTEAQMTQPHTTK